MCLFYRSSRILTPSCFHFFELARIMVYRVVFSFVYLTFSIRYFSPFQWFIHNPVSLMNSEIHFNNSLGTFQFSLHQLFAHSITKHVLISSEWWYLRLFPGLPDYLPSLIKSKLSVACNFYVLSSPALLSIELKCLQLSLVITVVVKYLNKKKKSHTSPTSWYPFRER